jgi:endonuclease/exonuclease/phosphatase family metal-dependent hydrolase
MKQAGFHDAVGQESVETTRRGERLDWIFVRGPLRFDKGKVHREIVASDHYPLSVRVSLVEAPLAKAN